MVLKILNDVRSNQRGRMDIEMPLIYTAIGIIHYSNCKNKLLRCRECILRNMYSETCLWDNYPFEFSGFNTCVVDVSCHAICTIVVLFMCYRFHAKRELRRLDAEFIKTHANYFVIMKQYEKDKLYKSFLRLGQEKLKTYLYDNI